MDTETTGQSEPTRQRLLQRFADWTKALAQVVSEAADRHRLLAALTPKDAATFLLNSREGAVLRARVDRDRAPVDTFEKVAFASLFKGEKRSPTRTSARKGQNDNKQIVLQVLKGAFIDRDPGIVAKYFMPDYKQHNPSIPDGAAAIATLIPRLGANFSYEPGMAVAEGDLVMVHGCYVGWGPKPMVAVDIFRVVDGKVAEHWDVMQEEVPAEATASGNSMFSR